MSLSKKTIAELDTSAAVKAAQRTRAASSAAAANAASAARSAAAAAQHSAHLAQAAAQNATVIAASVARNAGGTAQTAASDATKGVRQGVYTARSWAAPRLDSAADYCTTTVGPTLSSALHATARQVSPPQAAKPKKSTVLTWSMLGAAVATALGAAAVMARYRYRAAIAADSEAADEEVPGGQTATAAPDGSHPAATDKDQAAEKPVNGRTASRGW